MPGSTSAVAAVAATTAPRPSSPCTKLCDIDPGTQLCRGCARTLDEIARWGTMSAAEREVVWRALDHRRAT